MKIEKKNIMITGIFILAIFITYMLLQILLPQETEVKNQLVIPSYTKKEYAYVEVERGNLEKSKTVILRYQSDVTQDYYFNIDFDKVGKVCVIKGDYVKRGDLLAELECQDIKDNIKRIKEEMQALDTNITYQKEMKSLADTKEEKEAFDLAIQNDTGSKNVLAEELKEAQMTLLDYQIYADIDGQVTYIPEYWDLIYANVSKSDKIISIEGVNSGFIGTFDEEYISVLEETTQIEIDDVSYDIKLMPLGEANDSGKLKIMYTLMDESIDMKNGASGKLTFELGKMENILYLPEKCIFIIHDECYVYRLDEDGYRSPIQVLVGETVGTYTEIKEGLEEGEQVCYE